MRLKIISIIAILFILIITNIEVAFAGCTGAGTTTCGAIGSSQANCNVCGKTPNLLTDKCSWTTSCVVAGTVTSCSDIANEVTCIANPCFMAMGCSWSADTTCTYGGSGDWQINLADNCVLVSTNLGQTNSLHTYGTGTLTIPSGVTIVADQFDFHGSGTIAIHGNIRGH